MSTHNTQLHNDRKVANTATSGGYSGNNIAKEQVDENAAKEKRHLDNKKLNLALDGKLDEAGLMETSVKPAANASDSADKKNKKDKDKSHLALHLALMDSINAMNRQIYILDGHINALQSALNDLDNGKSIEEVIQDPAVRDAIEAWEKRTGQKFDPNHPDARGHLQDILDDTITARDGIKQDRDNALKTVEDKHLSGFDGTKLLKDEALTKQSAEAKDAQEQSRDKSDELKNIEDDLTALTLEDIKDLRGSPAYITAIDAHIDTLSTDTKRQMIKDENIQPGMLDRLLVDKFNQMYDRIQGLEGDRYNMALEKTLERADERTIEALSRDPNLPEDVRQILEEKETEQAPSVDASRVSVAHLLDGDERPDEEKLNTCFNNCAVGVATDTALVQEKVLDHTSTIKHENNGMGLGG